MNPSSTPRTLPQAAILTLALLVLSPLAPAQQRGDRPSPRTQPAPAFDTGADARAEIAAALVKAKRDNQRVLLMFGANWCGWSRKLDTLFKENREIARTLLYEYQLVKVDVGRRDNNMDIADRYEANVENAGIPFLSVLDADGNVLVAQETGELEQGDHHDPAKVQDFLQMWKAEPLDARKVFEQARAQAAKQHKRLLLHLGVPSCKWCRRLDDFLQRKDIADLVARDFLPVKIDLRRMTRADEVAKRFRQTDSGNPWFAIVDVKGHVLATSVGPKGNVGFPVEPYEIAHFMDVFRKTARHMTTDDLRRIEQALEDSAARIKAGRE